MAYRITLIPGDGTGPELAAAARRVLDATGVPIEWEEQHAGAEVMEKEGTPLPAAVLESIRRNKVALKGPITTPIGTGFRSVNVALRHELISLPVSARANPFRVSVPLFRCGYCGHQGEYGRPLCRG